MLTVFTHMRYFIANAPANTLFAGSGNNVLNGLDGIDTVSYVNVT